MPELCRSRAELLRGGSDGCVEKGLPWKSSSLSGSAVTAPMVRRGGRLRFGVPVGSDVSGSVPRGGGCVVLCRVKLGASLFQARLNHPGSGTRSHALAGLGLVPGMGHKERGWAGGSWAGGPSLPGLCPVDGDGEGSPFTWGWNVHLSMAGRRGTGHPCLLLPVGSRLAGLCAQGARCSSVVLGQPLPGLSGALCACTDGSRRDHPSCGWWKRGDTLPCHLYPRAGFLLAVTGSRALVLPSGMELWGCSLWLGFSLASSPPEQRPPAHPGSGLGAMSSTLWDKGDGNLP